MSWGEKKKGRRGGSAATGKKVPRFSTKTRCGKKKRVEGGEKHGHSG